MKRLLVTGMAGKSGLVFAGLLAEHSAWKDYDLRVLVRTPAQQETLRNILPQAEYVRRIWKNSPAWQY